jgi:hypothetical protein
MPDYSNAKVYKLVSDSCSEVYYGATTRKLSERLSQHKLEYSKKPNHKVMLQYEDCKIILLEKVSCNSKKELGGREQFYIRNNPCINIQIPNRTQKECLNQPFMIEARKQYALTHKEQKKEYDKLYREKNREQKKLRDKSYHDSLPIIQCECGGRYKQTYKNRHLKSTMHINFFK